MTAMSASTGDGTTTESQVKWQVFYHNNDNNYFEQTLIDIPSKTFIYANVYLYLVHFH